MAIFTEAALKLEILNTICDKLEIKSSALVFLNRSFSDDEIQALYTFLTKVELNQNPVTVSQIMARLQQIKPDVSEQTTKATLSELLAAFRYEKRFPWLLKQLF